MMRQQRPALLDRIPDRHQWAEELLDRLTPLMAPLGLSFLLVVLGQQLASPGSEVTLALEATGLLLWSLFVAEFVARLVVAPDTVGFLRRNWWQATFLVLPFLRVLRLVGSLQLLRSGQVLSSTVRGSRSAHQVLGSRLGWLTSVVAMVVPGASQLLHELSDLPTYGDALHDAKFGTLAATLGASFTEARGSRGEG